MGLVELPICKKDSLCMNQQQKTNVSKGKIARQLEYFSLHPYDLLCYFGTYERSASEFLFAATHYTHYNNPLISILKIIITESTMVFSIVSLTLKQTIFVNSKNVFLQ
jgi:hypothetical protein